MSIWNKWIPYIFVGALLIVVSYMYFSKSPRDIILDQLNELALELSVRHGETPLDQLEQTNKVVKKFGENFEIMFKVDGRQKPPITDSVELKRILLSVRKWVRQARVQFINIGFPDDGGDEPDSIILRGKLVFDSTQRKSKESDIEFKFSQFWNKWLIVRVEIFDDLDSSGKWKH